MIYRLHELLRFLGLQDGLFEQPGDSSSDGTVGAVNDQPLIQSPTGSTCVPSRALLCCARHAWARCNPSNTLHYARGAGGCAAWGMCQAARIRRE